MIKKTIKVYPFDKLPKKIQYIILDRNRYVLADWGWWSHLDYLLELTQKEKEKIKIKKYPDTLFKYNPNKIYFSLDRDKYIQFNNIDINDTEIFRKFLKLPNSLWNKTGYYFYNSQQKYSTRLCFNIFKTITKEEDEMLDRATAIMHEKFQDALRLLELELEYLTSDETIIDHLIINEYLYFSNGDFYNIDYELEPGEEMP